jgi:intraflagellar transport protein 46
MPSVDALMQMWPPEFEELLQSTSLPSADLECELKDYVDIVCGTYERELSDEHGVAAL